MQKKVKQPAVFVDRDGTINVEKDYLYKIEDFEFIPGAPEAICRLKKAGYLVIVVTNQSGVARGYYGLDDVAALHKHIQEHLAKLNTSVDAFYICPHHPEVGEGEFLQDCACRKGKPGLLMQAAAEHNVDLSRSYMVGDKVSDIEAGESAGCTSLLVLTGHGRHVSQQLADGKVNVCADIVEATEKILKFGELR